MYPKPKRIVNPSVGMDIKPDYCECCGMGGTVERHHLRSRGSGGPDLNGNIIWVCRVCHTKIHNGQIPRRNVEYIVRRREGEN